MIKAEIVAHSLSPQGDELISVLATFPRIILAEVNTHRMLSKNTSSSRAIPFKRMVESIEANPFIPIAWQKEHSGMQGSEYLTDPQDIEYAIGTWLHARDSAIEEAKILTSIPVTKQLANRLLEPFMWTTMLITGPRSGWDNFFELRCPQYILEGSEDVSTIPFKSKNEMYESFMEALEMSKPIGLDWDLYWMQLNRGQAEIHMMALAESVYDALNESSPKQLQAREWHIPFEDRILEGSGIVDDIEAIKVSVAMGARTSYTIIGEEKEINYENLIALHDRLLTQDPPHSSPMEHCARAMSNDEYNKYWKSYGTTYKDKQEVITVESGWCRNFKGFIPYRHIIESQN